MYYKRKYTNYLKKYSRERRQNQTPAEMILWGQLRNRQFLGIKFRRQFPIKNYILDFYADKYKLIIEIDGLSHDESRFDKDNERQEDLESIGYKFIRFTEGDIRNNLENVLQTLENMINESPHL